MEVPVYLFTGFLESGKTKFIQEALEGSDFNAGERTLLLLCEEGEEEYEPARFFGKNVFIEPVGEEELNPDHLEKLQRLTRAERVIVEYNGMWLLEKLFQAMPGNWVIYQEMALFDATTFLTYNQNMRQLVFDKMKTAEMVVFNRCDHSVLTEEKKLELHKIVRVANRKSQIIYEFGPDDAEPDNFVDPLPYDLSAPEITVTDDIYAEWYRDINEEQDKYEGKILKVKGRCALGGGLPENAFVFGRHVMTCCVEDIQFAGLLCKWNRAKKLKHGGWVEIKARVQNEYAEVYGEVGPVLYCQEVKASLPADPEVATF
ncbi:MAG: hypothetical protein IJM69_03660 [Firmicutes bacterium]|nr:hypothetical protein [Bacillota bacterium]